VWGIYTFISARGRGSQTHSLASYDQIDWLSTAHQVSKFKSQLQGSAQPPSATTSGAPTDSGALELGAAA
jgi:hypothetical protein